MGSERLPPGRGVHCKRAAQLSLKRWAFATTKSTVHLRYATLCVCLEGRQAAPGLEVQVS
jgi:hypothetical protein